MANIIRDGSVATAPPADAAAAVTGDQSATIAANAQSPAEVSQDGTTVKMPPVGEQIEADRYAASRAAHARGSTGLRFNKIVPPGSI